ncbi:MAG TPA: transporter substrate-binding domain-containing protein [Terriglobales bacterium]|nr:transporter substrate-binding domain-containing protein [Terriglobales bacterium]
MRHKGWWLSTLLPIVIVTSAAAASENKSLRVGISGDYPPFAAVAKIADPQVVDLTDPRVLTPKPAPAAEGFDIEVARRFAADSGRKLELVTFDWPELTAKLEAGAFDIAMSGITLRAERAMSGLFSRPYLITGAVAVVAAGEGDRVRSIDWLDAANVRLAVNRGGYLEGLAKSRFPNARLRPAEDNRELPQLLRHGSVDAVIAERYEALRWQKSSGVELSRPFTRDLKVYMVAPKSAALVEALDDWLARREEDGWLPQLRRRWVAEPSPPTKAELCVEAVRARIQTRFDLMPLVAAAKRRRGELIDDPGQEARVLSRAREQATRRNLSAEDVARLFRQLIEAAKLSQVHSMMSGTYGSAEVNLTALRRAIGSESDELIAELARCRPYLGQVAREAELIVPGITTAQAELILTTVAKIKAGKRAAAEPVIQEMQIP